MTDLSSGKGHKNENFPVASRLIAARHRPAILAFYRFARAADDISDHPTATPQDNLSRLEAMRATLAGEADTSPEAADLRAVCVARGLSPQHGLDLLEAFSRDCVKLRYSNWPDLMDYCRYSAAPVGRYVLDVHGENPALWPANDALCSALQIINHLQDCGKDFRELDRVYLPLDILAEHGAAVEDLGRPTGSPGLRAAIVDLVGRTDGLLRDSAVFPAVIADTRLALEVAVIQSLAERLATRLRRSDPLSERVHASKAETLAGATSGIARALWARRGRQHARPGEVLSQ